VILLSDGGDTASEAGLDEAVEALSSGDRNPGLYVVTLETAESDHSALNDAADRLGGQLLTTQSTETIQQFYLDIAGRLRSRYSVRFLPGQGEVALLSVAVDDSIATARTSLAALGITDAPIESEDAEPVASSLNDFVEPQLGAVLIDAPGLLGRSGAIWLGAASMFGALLVVFGFLTVPAMQVQSLGAVRSVDARGHASDLNQRLSGAADRFIRRRDQSGSLDRSLDAANLELRAGEFTVLLLVSMLAAGAVGSILFGWVGSIAAIFVTASVAVAYVSIRIRRRRRAFAEQLQGTINIIVGSLRAGRGLPQALEMVAQEASAPSSEEFRRVIVESRVGRDPIASLEAVADRMDNQDLEWIAQAIAINRELGGDLIELLQNVAAMVRERSRIAMKVRALSAEGRMSGWVMLALPILMYLYMRTVNPQYVGLLHTTSPGLIVSGGAIVAMILGGIWIRNLVNIKF
jgi:tight adherence protein B